MVTTPDSVKQSVMKISWEALPGDFVLEEEPVESTGQPLIAGSLREILELNDYIQPTMLIAGNLGICATVDGKLVIKAPDWMYVRSVIPLSENRDRRSYTPILEGEIPQVVMEFCSETDGGEYSMKRTFPIGKWFFYEQILQVPTYVIFHPGTGELEVNGLQDGKYKLLPQDENQRYWIAEMELFLGVWVGEKEGRNGYWLRWWDGEGNLLPWAVEKLEQERQRAEQERQRAEQERQRAQQQEQLVQQERQHAERLIAQLRSLGIEPSD